MGNLQLRLGMAGSGKTVGIANEITEEVQRRPVGERIFWIVPGVASYSTERRLLERIDGTIRAEIIHLNRLAERANQALQCVRGTPVNNTGKRLLLASVYQAASEDLAVLGRVRPSIGILDSILDVFNEMSQFAVSPENIEAQLEIAATHFGDLDESVQAVSGRSLLGKLRDLSLLYVHYKQEMSDRDLYDPLDLQSLVAPSLSAWPELQGATLYVDGFADIVPRDAMFIMQLAKFAARTVVTLELPQSLAAAEPASQAWLSFRRLTTLAEYEGVDVEFQGAPVRPDEGRFRTSGVLARLEERLRGSGSVAVASHHDLDGTSHSETKGTQTELKLRLVSAQNIRAEADGVAAAISTRRAAGGNPADTAVLVPDVDAYAAYLRESFDVHGIPYTIDEYPGLIFHPLTKFVLASLMVIEDNFSLESMHRLLKTEFCGLTDGQADWLQTYTTTYEVEGASAWFLDREWTFAAAASDERMLATGQKMDERAEAIRHKLLNWLQPLYKQLTAEMKPADLALALWNLFVATGVKSTVASWMANETDLPVPREDESTSFSPSETLAGSLHEQAWLKWIALLNDLSETQAGVPLQRSFLFSLIDEECRSQSLTTIPQGLGQVRVFSYQHAVGWEAPEVYVLGAADGVFPGRVSHRGLLQDEERRQFAALFGQRLGYTTTERQNFQHHTVYGVLTRATRQLTVSSPLANQDGKAVRPSLLFQQLQEWLPADCEVFLWARSQGRLFESDQNLELPERTSVDIIHMYPLARMLEEVIPVLQTVNISPSKYGVFRTVVSSLLKVHSTAAALESSLRGLAHKTRALPLTKELISRLYSDNLVANVYQLETFAACSYRHYAQYGLRLQTEQLPEVTPAERGTLIHDTLQDFVQKQMDDVERWRQLSEEEAVEAVEQVFADVMARPKAQIWLRKPSRWQQAQDALALLRQAAIVLTRHLRYSQFVPKTLELSFGDKAESLPLVTVPLRHERRVSLRGRLDRLDVAGEGSNKVFRVVDYKSSELDLDLTRVEHGLRLQLPVYGLAAAQNSSKWADGPAKLTGLLYFPVTTKVEVTASPQPLAQAQANHVKSMRARGWMIEDSTVISWMDERLDTNHSDLFKKVYKTDGTVQKTAPVLPERHWNGFLGHVLKRVQNLSEGILDGKIAVNPFRLGTEEACTFCPYQAVCQLDKRYDAVNFRWLTAVKREDIEAWAADADILETWLPEEDEQS